jgi:hypothetical protein
MALLELSVKYAVGVARSDKRGVAFLEGELTLNGAAEFKYSAKMPLGKRIRHRMGLWIQMVPDAKGKYHGFRERKYRDCFTFIDIEEKIRYYGFRCHPKQDNPRYELIVLTSCVQKKEDAVDKAELDRVLMWKNSMATAGALKNILEDDGQEVK